MAQATSLQDLDTEYRVSWELVQRVGLRALNCGYLCDDNDSLYRHQQNLIWRLLKHAPVGPDSVVLDVGCGIGGPTGWLFERFSPRLTVGVEYLTSSVRTANELWADRSPRPYFVQADAHHLPIQTDSVDVILNCESALHYSDKHRFLRECHRVLKPGGHLCLGDITAPSPWFWALTARFARPRVYIWSDKQYRAAFDERGFEIVDHEEASSKAAAAMRSGFEEISTADFADVRDLRRRVRVLRILAWLLHRKGLTYDLFTVRAR